MYNKVTKVRIIKMRRAYSFEIALIGLMLIFSIKNYFPKKLMNFFQLFPLIYKYTTLLQSLIYRNSSYIFQYLSLEIYIPLYFILTQKYICIFQILYREFLLFTYKIKIFIFPTFLF